eukprot:superscaffoldBa00007097_g22218
MTLSARDPRDIDPIVTRRYFYSIKDISVGGMCICYGHAQSCPLDPVTKGGGVCIDCQQNTAGINCETCTDGYYRPAQVCLQVSVCVRRVLQVDSVTVVRLDIEIFLSVFAVNVMGAHCDLCKPGFYNLQAAHPLGCTDCFCFGVSDVCESTGWSTVQMLHTDAWLRPSQSHQTHPVVHGNDLPIPRNTSSGHAHQQLLSWAAPNSFLGNKLVSYGGFLNYTVVYDIPLDNEDRSLPAHSDIIMEGNGRALRLSPPLHLFLSPLAGRSVAIMMVPQQFMDMQTGRLINRDDLLSVLADVTSLRVRVHLNTSADGPIRLSAVSLDVADSGAVSGVQAVAVETCECPWGYSGTSCECLPGFYGDATEGTAEDCQRCPCPLTEPTNSFSLTCVLDTSGKVSCDQCQDGYTGTNCERCASGFYGNPQVVGGTCTPCECNGNVDVSEAGHCDTVTGECLRCLGNTAGRHCEVGVAGRRCEECISGWFGLSAESPDGCSQCFCSGLSGDCEEQGGLSRVPITLARSPALLTLVSQSNLQGVVSGVYQQNDDILLDTRQLNTSRLAGPLYWRLPRQFEGNQLLSYGGLLSYVVTFYAEDGSGLANREPQVLMRGGTLMNLVIYTDMVAPGNGIRTQHVIRLTEHKWKYFNSVSEKPVSRADFMSVLSNIQYVIIKASYGTRLQQSRISNVTMETAVEAEKAEGGGARLIESCICPPGYAGLSCQ